MAEANAVQPNQPTVEDPLVAGLPPAMDHITYLTLLEYQLTPQNLPTLNRLLRGDDGALASEIGWDLLKLVLPILRVNQESAQDCLDIIARRGNPREVIVRVSEELERLGQHEDDHGDNEAVDNQTAFEGEAPPVHLGQMTLEGKTKPVTEDATSQTDDKAEADMIEETHVPGIANDEITFSALVSMLPPLHSRIKTKHPSRFLATSLPAALSAFRRLSMSETTTSAFLKTLTSLGGTKRPPLPPRVSTTDLLKSNSMPAPLPDPESKTADAPDDTDTILEASINERLLQAVLLEVFEERTVVSMEDHPPLTAQLRLKLEPQSLLSTRRAEIESLASNEAVQIFDKTQAAFTAAAKTLKLDLLSEITNALKSPAEIEEVGEYPTSPAHIPLSTLGLLLLYSSEQVARLSKTTELTNPPPEIFEALRNIVVQKDSEDYNKIKDSMPAIDNVLSLIYLSRSSEASQSHLLNIVDYLLDVCTSCPDVDLRDNAYHITTHLIHGRLDRASRTTVLRKLVTGENEQLRSIAVNWLKDEVFPTQNSQTVISKQPESQRGLKVLSLSEFDDALFSIRGVELAENDSRQFGEDIPFYISVINLLVLLARYVDDVHADGVDLVLAKGEALLNKLEKINADLVARVGQSAEGEDEQELSALDIFALEDALIRAREAIPLDQ